MSILSDARDYLHRKLQEPEPATGIAGGGNTNDPEFTPQQRDRDRLEQYEAVYQQGGVEANLIDTRAHMIHGTGTEFITDDDDLTVRVPWAEDRVTAAEWLNHELETLDNLLVSLARDAYIYGDWLTETVPDQAGGFGRIVTINPKTMEPKFNDKGRIVEWQQFIQAGPLEGRRGEVFDPEDIGHGALITLGRHPLGISLVGRAFDQIERFQNNQRAIEEALEKHAFRRWHIQVQASVDDNELRRIRQRFHQVSDYRELTTGRDIEIDPLDEGGIGESITDIADHDLKNLANAFGVPPEFSGLMTSTEALSKTNLQRFERMGRGEQRRMADQFVREVVRDILEQYSPFPRDVDISLEYGDIVSDQTATAEWLRDFKGSYTHDEIRKKLGDGPVPDSADIDGDDIAQQDDAGGGGGLFDDLSGGPDTGNRHLMGDGHEPWEQTWHELIEHALWTDDTERQLFQFNPSEVPEFVLERLREAINDSLFSDFESIPSGARMAVRQTLLDSLDERHGWSIRSIQENLQDAVSGLSEHEAETIARSETQALVSEARERGYRDRLDMDDARFDWVGPNDDRNSDECPWIKQQIPEEGVTMDRLKELIQQAPDAVGSGHDAREWSPHPQCRHQPVRVVD